MRKIILALVYFMATLFSTTLPAHAQNPLPPVATGIVTDADALAAYQKGHIVQPNPRVVQFFQDLGLEDTVEALQWYKYKGLLYGFFILGHTAFVFVLQPNGDFIDLFTMPEP
jgi:hypothetical protein